MENKKIDYGKWVQIAMVVITIAAGAFAFVIRIESQQAQYLKEVDAYKSFATKQELKDALDSINKNLESINGKLDRHMQRDDR